MEAEIDRVIVSLIQLKQAHRLLDRIVGLVKENPAVFPEESGKSEVERAISKLEQLCSNAEIAREQPSPSLAGTDVPPAIEEPVVTPLVGSGRRVIALERSRAAKTEVTSQGVDNVRLANIKKRRETLRSLGVSIPSNLESEPTTNDQADELLSALMRLK